MGDPGSLLFVDDDASFLAHLSRVLDGPYRTARSCAEALQIASPPGVAFVDHLGLPDGEGVGLIRRLGVRWPGVPVVVLTRAHADAQLLAVVRAGARGYLLKDDAGQSLEQAARDAIDGGAPMSPRIARRVLDLLRAEGPAHESTDADESLTPREVAVLRELARGSSYLQAATALDVSINTLRVHVRNAYRKLAVGTKTEAVLAAQRRGLVDR